jgi:hypothetical protein
MCIMLSLLAGMAADEANIVHAQAPIRFPTLDTSAPQPVVTAPPADAAPYTPSTAPGVADASAATPNPFAAPATSSPAPTLAPGGYSAPGTAPVATLNGAVQPPPPNFDPYAPPGTAPPVMPLTDPCYPPPPGPFTLPPVLATPYRFLQEVSLDYHWFAGHGSNTSELGINDIDLKSTFALPMSYWQSFPEPPLLITPGFAWHYWDGPSSNAAGNPDMPPRTYDAYLDAAWAPVFVPCSFSAELDARVGIYSDFSEITSQSIRIMGKGVAVVAIPDTTLTMKFGVWYINREKYKLLPAGGFVWKPSPVTRFDILFPNPKFTQQLYMAPGGTEWWWYLSGDYGGGVWTIKRSLAPTNPNYHIENDQIDLMDYDDIRVALGVDFRRPAGFAGFVEGGYAFERQLNYASGLPSSFTPNGAFYVHAGVSF